MWHARSGLFAYAAGCVVVVEDLETRAQRHFLVRACRHTGLILETGSVCFDFGLRRAMSKVNSW